MDRTTKVYHDGNKITVGLGGSIDVKAGGMITADGDQAAAIADAAVGQANFADLAAATAASNATNAKLNSVIAALRGVGIIDT